MELKKIFFSIVIPAHNEELYIKETLSNIKGLNYPVDSFEVIVVENGSTDKTFDIAKESASANMNIFSSAEKGVSKARNFGIRHIRSDSDWVVFLDADTILKPEFLNDLNTYLQVNQAKNYVIGTATLLPIPDTKYARRWFAFYDIGHKVFKASYSIQFAKASILKNIKYDEGMTMGEDLKFIKEALKYGKFFLLKTQAVFTSTRRFESSGWWRILFQWVFVASLPISWQKKFGYKVTR